MTIYIHNIILLTKSLLYHLVFSLFSVRLYYNICKQYVGYGIKYTILISFISSMIYCIKISTTIEKYNDYFSKNKIYSKQHLIIDYILDQFPILHYNGTNLTSVDTTPKYLLDNLGNKTVLIDLSDDIQYQKKYNIPITLTSKFIIINYNTIRGYKVSIPIAYNQLLLSNIKYISKHEIKEYIAKTLTNMHKFVIFILLPISTLTLFLSQLIENIFAMLSIYITANLLNLNFSLTKAIRLTLFSNGTYLLFNILFLCIVPSLSKLLILIKISNYTLITLTLLKIKKEQY